MRQPETRRRGIADIGKAKPLSHLWLERLVVRASVHNASLVNPLIPFAGISKSAQQYSQRGPLPCVIFLKVAGWVETYLSKQREKAIQ
jgi:hypothetical protein